MLTIVTANTDRLLLTRAEIAAVVSETDGGKLDALNARVSALIVKACRVPSAGATPPTLRLEDVSDTYRLKSTQKELILSRRPVVTIASLVENSVTLTEGTDFECDTSAGLLYRLSSDCRICWPWGLIVATYNGGWAVIPEDLKAIAAELAQSLWSDQAKIDPNLRSEEIPGVISRTWWVDAENTSALPERLMNALSQGGYVNLFVG